MTITYERRDISGKQQKCVDQREECGREQDHAAFNAWKYQHYFEFDSVKSDKNISICCTLCMGRKLLSTAKNSTSNLNKHLTSQHRNVKLIENPRIPPLT